MKVLQILILILVCQYGMSQSLNYDLNYYHLPTLKYKSLVGQFEFNGSKNEQKTLNRANLSIDSYSYSRKPNAQKTIFINVQTAPVYQTLNQVHTFNWTSNVHIATQNRFYRFKNKKFFFEIDGVIDNYWRNQLIQEPNSSSIDLSVTIPIMFGWGRIEDITQAWRAYRMFESFDKLQLLYQQPNEQEFLGLANEIAIQKNKRYLDFRDGNIQRITAIHQYLEKINLLHTKSIGYFTALNDTWSYGTNTRQRISGTTYSIGLEPSYSIFRHNDMGIKDPLVKRMALLALARIEMHKALNIKWQIGLDTRLRTGIIKTPESTTVSAFSATFNCAYFPTDRTSFIASANTEYLSHEESFNYNLNFYAYYYLSPQLRIQANARLVKNYQFIPYSFYGDPLSSNFSVPLRYDLITGQYLNNTKAKLSYSIKFIYNFY